MKNLTCIVCFISIIAIISCNDSSTNKLIGNQSLINIIDEVQGTNCASGGKKIETGIDLNDDGILTSEEVTNTSYVCNGVNGTNGTNGTNGAPGANGTNGTNGAPGAPGVPGTPGLVSSLMVKESDGVTDIGFLIDYGMYSTSILVMNKKGYLLNIDLVTGALFNGYCSYKQGGTPIADCSSTTATYHNASNCSDSDALQDGIAYWTTTANPINKNYLMIINSNFYVANYTTIISTSYKYAATSCTANLQKFYALSLTSAGVTGAKATYSVPLRFFNGTTELL